jgi:hypothetical protein
MDRTCPICHRILTCQPSIDLTDYECYPALDDHHYAERFIMNDKRIIRVRLGQESNRMVVKINFDKGITEVWRGPPVLNPRKTIINQTFTPDFSDLDKLREKFMTYLLFS